MATTAPANPTLPHSGAQKDQDTGKPFTFHAAVTYGSPDVARMVRDALAVDPELRPDVATRELTVVGDDLVLYFSAVDARTLRASVGTFCDLLALATRTAEAFPPLEPRCIEP